jgi:hypothetical protein
MGRKERSVQSWTEIHEPLDNDGFFVPFEVNILESDGVCREGPEVPIFFPGD